MNSGREKIVLFGGTFDPVHHGHLICARRLAEERGFDRVLLVPTARPPHKAAPRASAKHRLAMLRLAVEGEDLFEVCESELRRGGASYTYDTLAAVRAGRPDAELHWVIGEDMLADLPHWHRAAEVMALAEVLVMARPPPQGAPRAWHEQVAQIPDRGPKGLRGLEARLPAELVERLRRQVVATPLLDISSSEIRRRLAAGLSVRYLLPEPVRQYILKHRLYL